EVWYFIRAPQRDQVEELTARIRNIAKGATLMTETTVDERFEAGAYNILPNDVLADLMQQILEDLGPISFTDEEQAYAQTIVDGYPAGTIEAGMAAADRPMSLLEKPLVEAPQPINDEGKSMPGSTDVGDVSWITPTVTAWTTCAPAGIPGHSWGIVAAGGMSIGHKGMLHAAKTMALTAVELFTNPDTLQQAQDEFKQRTGGKPYKCPIPDDVEPPLP
ncbi:MAG TPA: hypothetical protein VKU87_03765, partial [Thermomicrobiaceae bacterium]|nr:hypothetical protein [Thermomicrobiaceae bacterium]